MQNRIKDNFKILRQTTINDWFIERWQKFYVESGRDLAKTAEMMRNQDVPIGVAIRILLGAGK